MDTAAREVILEFHRVGNAVKVTAVDPQTFVEVSIVGSPATSEAELSRIAIKKLDYVLNRRRDGRGIKV
jgi:phage head maturation protease